MEINMTVWHIKGELNERYTNLGVYPKHFPTPFCPPSFDLVICLPPSLFLVYLSPPCNPLHPSPHSFCINHSAPFSCFVKPLRKKSTILKADPHWHFFPNSLLDLDAASTTHCFCNRGIWYLPELFTRTMLIVRKS